MATATRPKTKKPKLTPDERKAKREEAQQKLEEAILNLQSSEGWQDWLRVRARFHKYSAANTWLIALQKPEATRVAGYRKWQQLGRQVKQGETAIKIWVPWFLKQKDENGQPIKDENGQEKTKVWFVLGNVFDVSQTEGDPLPEITLQPVDGDELEHMLSELERFARLRGYSVSYQGLEKGLGGYVDHRSYQIVISNEHSHEHANMRVKTLIHEIAHTYGVSYADYPRPEAECIVESAAFVVMGILGIDTSDYSIPYVATWTDANAEVLKKHASKVDEIVQEFEKNLNLEEVENVS